VPILENEKRMHRVLGYRSLPALKASLGSLCRGRSENELRLDREATEV
jgi:hypothetical protein